MPLLILHPYRPHRLLTLSTSAPAIRTLTCKSILRASLNPPGARHIVVAVRIRFPCVMTVPDFLGSTDQGLSVTCRYVLRSWLSRASPT